MPNTSLHAAALAAFALSALTAFGAVPSIAVTDIWTRPTPAIADTGVVYLTIKNSAAEPDRLVAMTSPAARKVSIHETQERQGLMRMRPLASLSIPARSQVVAAPGGIHIMLEGLKTPLIAGAAFPLTLKFARSREMTVTVAIRKQN